MSDRQGYVSVTVPVRLVGSHGVSKPGFESAVQKGTLSTAVTAPAPGEAPFDRRFSATDLVVLGFEITSFEVSEPVEGWQELKVVFATAQTAEAIEQFLQRFANALTASFASGQRDPWYGNLVVEVGWGGMRLTRAAIPGVTTLGLHDSLSIAMEVNSPLSARALESLQDSSLTEIFVEGMRANRPRAKYISWFIMIEELERLATDPEFSHLFAPLFPKKEDRNAVAKASGLTGKPLERLRGFLGDPKHTVENRPEKLCALLQAIGIREVPALSTTTIIDVDLCQRLVDGRNALAHKGTKADEDLLYLVLFPLSCRVMEYLNTRGPGLRGANRVVGLFSPPSNDSPNGEMPVRT